MYAGDEYYGDDITSGIAEPVCALCEMSGHWAEDCPDFDFDMPDDDSDYSESTGDYGQYD
jgi:hypothetical protein